jgi:hypothetical protein
MQVTALDDDLVNPGLSSFKNPGSGMLGGHQMASAPGWTEPEATTSTDPHRDATARTNPARFLDHVKFASSADTFFT